MSALNFLGYRQAKPSLLGIGVLMAAAAQSAHCGYMAWIALAGLAVNTIWGKSWADPVAAKDNQTTKI